MKGQRYTAGFNRPDTYFTPHVETDASTTLPISGAKLHVIESNPPEALLLTPAHGGAREHFRPALERVST